MKNLSILFVISLVTILSACSTTQNVAINKKPLISDHHLMLSLLNREITQDQQMMLAFAEQREQYQPHYFINTIEIKGPIDSSYSTKKHTRVQHNYSNLIAQDFNSVQISGPN